ncbi:flagellar biosynthesis anti-sigma factor FlgM [Peribacillus alkalitolerans]|uniref:flagellar biosynthesis anti-sigma factor FlgM n=1 Tax=Peribacillus alkalitolerans TaxID=1550385 RepID=UPI0013D24D5D|nr:flagellar biosynthesis anti-sigma factor FlgM [Peribacillus alkalitolerans]
MKINNFGPSGVNPYRKNLQKVEGSNKTNFAKADKIEISSTAKDLQHMTQIPSQRQAKVDELKLQVENGTYKLSAKETAKSILDFYSKK